MQNRLERIVKLVPVLLLMTGSLALAANDPSIKGELRTQIQAAMKTFIDNQTMDGVLRLYDPVEDNLLKVKLKKLHPGIVKKGDFYVSCADFVDSNGRKYDLDFLVISGGDRLTATQAVVHSIDGRKRKYHLEK